MADDSRNTIARLIDTGSGVSSVSRAEQVRLKEAVIVGTLDGDTATIVDLVALGLERPIVVAASCRCRQTTATTEWNIYDNRGAASATVVFRIEWNSSGHGTTPYAIEILDVGTNFQGEPFVLWVKYIEGGKI